MSTRDTSSKIGNRVSHATIANFERGRSHPTMAILAMLATAYDRPINWFLESGPALHDIQYRCHTSKAGVRDKLAYEAEGLKWLLAYRRIEDFVGCRKHGPRLVAPTTATTAASFAAATRSQLAVGQLDPIPSVINALEACHVRVIELAAPDGIDGFAAELGGERVVVLNPQCSNDRFRFNAAHELFHHLLGHCSEAPVWLGKGLRDEEEAAFACARHFLLPREKLVEAFTGESFVKLVRYKERFGISIAAMVYAAQREGILPERKAKLLWVEMSRRGWRLREPGNVRPDRATTFEQFVDELIMQGRLTWTTAAQVAAVREDELRERVRLAASAETVEPPKGGLIPSKPHMRLAL